MPKPKHLTVHGNSLALLIERPTLRLLGITRHTELNLTTDGCRLIIEPLPPKQVANRDDRRPSSAPERRRAELFLRELGKRGVLEECFPKLAEGMRQTTYEGWLDVGIHDARVERVMERIRICVEGLHAGRALAELVDAALAAVPIPP